ncbi:MAG TPA: family 10 glycosylhydrolase [Fimbriimonadaceae bacterium]|nr:family 10 glycosylhydrolase [Fimbriimonadaceae bacterium]HRJ97299.1 family 10 glycosylhydrolase [Fimbriimonadaceae bacterium]
MTPWLVAMVMTPTEPPSPPREFRGVWVATVDNIDWPSRRDLDTAAQKRELLAILDKASALRFNAIVFQVRPHGDALYPSRIEPWSEYLTGAQGTAPSPAWDPLAFAVVEGHRRGLEVHAWINPYRAWHPAAKKGPAPGHIVSRRPDLVRTYGQYRWMDPAEDDVRRQTLAVVKDIVTRYDVDGLHIDDYFYPYPVRDKAGKAIEFPDDAAYRRYRETGGKASRADWRRQHVDDLVRAMYETIKSSKRWVKFGISPFGIYRPGVPAGIKAGLDQYAELYADARRWLREGWCDYFTPQLYWRIEPPAQSYPALLGWWLEQNSKGRHLWPGNYASQVANGWPAQEIVDQIELTRKSKASGNVLFSMKPLLRGTAGLDKKLAESAYRHPAIVPASPWLGDDRPGTPVVKASNRSGGSWRVLLAEPKQARFLALYALRDGEWNLVSISDDTHRGVPDTGVDALAVSVLSRTGIESPRVVLRPPKGD